MGIKAGDEPLYEAITNMRDDIDRYREFLIKLVNFADGNDVNDEVGVSYLAKLYAKLCPDPATETYESLGPVAQRAVEDTLNFPQTVFKKAAEQAGCNFLKSR